MSYRLPYLENIHFSNFQHPASEAANKFEKQNRIRLFSPLSKYLGQNRYFLGIFYFVKECAYTSQGCCVTYRAAYFDAAHSANFDEKVRKPQSNKCKHATYFNTHIL